jgi:starch phosphorylase
MGLGNGGLGRLARVSWIPRRWIKRSVTGSITSSACSAALSTDIGRASRRWIIFGDPEVVRPEYTQQVRLYGRVESVFDDRGNYRPRWVDTKTILGVPHDIPIAGYRTNTVNLLRQAGEGDRGLRPGGLQQRRYVEAVREGDRRDGFKGSLSERQERGGKELRLVQQYFFVACSLRDVYRRHFRLPAARGIILRKVAVSSTAHPQSIVELMRI